MCEREVVCDFVSAVSSTPTEQQRNDDFEEKLRQIRADIEREYKDKLQKLTAGLEGKHAQQLERVRKEKEVELRMLKLQLEQERRSGDRSIIDETGDVGEAASTSLNVWRSTENMADVILNSVQASTASTTALFQQGPDADRDGDDYAEDEQEEEDMEESTIQKEKSESDGSKVVSPDESKQVVATKSKYVQTKADSTKISVLRISKGDLVLLVFDPQFKTYVVFSVSPTLYILKDSCLQRMGVRPPTQAQGSPGNLDTSRAGAEGGGIAGESPKQRWILGKVVELDYCQIKKPTNRYRLPMNTRFFRVATEPVMLKTQP